MNNIFESINNTTDSATEIGGKYLEDTQEYFKLKVFQQLTLSISMLAKAMVIGGLLFIGLIFLSVAAALAIGSWIESTALGYIIVAAFYLICGGVIYSQRAIFNEKIIAKMAPKFFNFKMKKSYKSFEEIEYELQRLKLEREIGVEKLKEIRQEFRSEFQPLNWVTSAAKFAGKYGIFMFAKNLFKKF